MSYKDIEFPIPYMGAILDYSWRKGHVVVKRPHKPPTVFWQKQQGR